MNGFDLSFEAESASKKVQNALDLFECLVAGHGIFETCLFYESCEVCSC